MDKINSLFTIGNVNEDNAQKYLRILRLNYSSIALSNKAKP